MKKRFKVTYLGGPTVIITFGGLRLMTDPTLDPSGVRFPAGPEVMIEKLSDPALTDIGKIDIVLLSHDQHGDNLDTAGRALLENVTQTFSTPAAAERLKGIVTGLQTWESVMVTTSEGDELIITATPARHGPTHIEALAGEVTGFILTVKDDPENSIYLTGDTVFYHGIEEVAKRFHPKYVFIFAGAAKPGIPFNLTMGANDAVDTAFAFPNATIIPIHFEGWSHFSENASALIGGFAALGISERLKILPPGESVSLD